MRVSLLAVAALLSACVEADLDANGYYICTEDAHCAPGKVCRWQHCYDDPPPACSPYGSEGCPAGQRCATPTSGPVCVAAGPQGPGQSCEGDLTCASGTIPVEVESGCECRQLCRTDTDCAGPFTCSSTLVERDNHHVWGKVPIGLCD
jgi:hypothetical protein